MTRKEQPATFVVQNPGQNSTVRCNRILAYVADLIVLCRPKHWVKNLFVFAPLMFGHILSWHEASTRALTVFLCFCLFSGAVYCFNDAIDAEADRLHPRKRLRPIAVGRISSTTALTLSVLLVGIGVLVASLFLETESIIIGLLYLANNILYSLCLKTKVIVDVISIAVGFVLRLIAGAIAISVIPSPWLIVCGFCLSLLLGFGKRRLEVEALQEGAQYRKTLESYTVKNLDILLAITSSVTLVSYMLYSISPETVALHGTTKLIYTVPFVAYGIFRFIFKVEEGRGDGPVEILTSDVMFLVNGLLWVGAIMGILKLG